MLSFYLIFCQFQSGVTYNSFNYKKACILIIVLVKTIHCTKNEVFLRIWSHLLKKSLIESFIFCAVIQFKFYKAIVKIKRTSNMKNRNCLIIMKVWKRLIFKEHFSIPFATGK